MTELKIHNPLPNFEKADIAPEKFYEYSMNPDNIGNQKKWMAFEKIGYRIHNPKERKYAAWDIIDQLRNRIPYAPAIPNKAGLYGQRYKVCVQLIGPEGKTGILVTIWQIETKENIPRLITNWLEVHNE